MKDGICKKEELRENIAYTNNAENYILEARIPIVWTRDVTS